MKRAITFCIVLTLLFCSACSSNESRYSNEAISSLIGVDVSQADIKTIINNYDGFHGDGACCISMPFGSDTCLTQIKNNPLWNELPLTDNLTAIVYGIETDTSSIGPYISFDDFKTPAVPYIENGYYFFEDRHYESVNSKDDTDILNRNSFNLTIAIYDVDTDTLYYLELDT